jgi:Flp pilus assembly protein TadG
MTAQGRLQRLARSGRSRIRSLQRNDRGSAAAELTLCTPLLILLLLFVVFCGRVADTSERLNDVAHQAVRAATLARSSGQAVASAQATASEALASAGINCQSLSVSTDTQGLRPGSTVTVTVSCTVGLGDLTMLGLPGSRTFESSFSSPVDVYRGTSTNAQAGGA